MPDEADVVQLKEDTLAGYSDYIAKAESAMAETLLPDGPFLWSRADGERAGRVDEGKTIAQLWSGKHPVPVHGGLVHDWIGATRIPAAGVGEALAVVQDYDNHKNTYRPEVIDSRLLDRNGDNFQILLRLLKKKIITVVLDTYHDVTYYAPAADRSYCISRTTRIVEVEHAGKPSEHTSPPDTGRGFLWRLYSCWRFGQVDDAVYVECRAISLSRDIPTALAWIIEPIVKKLPRESLIATLDHTRAAVQALQRPAPTPDPNASARPLSPSEEPAGIPPP